MVECGRSFRRADPLAELPLCVVYALQMSSTPRTCRCCYNFDKYESSEQDDESLLLQAEVKVDVPDHAAIGDDISKATHIYLAASKVRTVAESLAARRHAKTRHAEAILTERRQAEEHARRLLESLETKRLERAATDKP